VVDKHLCSSWRIALLTLTYCISYSGKGLDLAQLFNSQKYDPSAGGVCFLYHLLYFASGNFPFLFTSPFSLRLGPLCQPDVIRGC